MNFAELYRKLCDLKEPERNKEIDNLTEETAKELLKAVFSAMRRSFDEEK